MDSARAQTQSPTDADLMRQLAGGDIAALGELAQRHHKRIHAVAMRYCGNVQDAEDLAQETFLRVWRAADRYEPSAAFTTWLYRIVVNLALDLRRGRQRSPEPMPGEADRPTAASGPDAPVEQAELAEQVRRAIASLPERQRIVLILHRYESLGHKQIAQSTGWTESAVESLLVRAYQSLRQKLSSLKEL